MKKLGIFFFLFSLFFLVILIPKIGAEYQAFDLLGEGFNTNDAKLFPYIIGSIILLLSILMTIKGFIPKTKDQTRQSENINWKKITDVGILLLISLGYTILLEPLGFFIMTPLALFICLWFFGMRKWLSLSAIPIVVTIFIFVCFEVLMSIQLPKGILEWMFY